MSIEIEIDYKDVLKSLKQFPINIQKNVLVGSVRAGAKPLVNEARANTPTRSGNLKKSIGIVKRKTKDKSFIWFSVTPRRGGKYDGWYDHLVEFGHELKSKSGKSLGFVPPVPFMRKAYENQTDESIKASTEYMRKRIDKEIQKSRVN